MTTWIAFKSILLKDIKTYYLKPPNISWGLLFPISWTLMFFLRTEAPVDIPGFLPGLISLSILFGTTSMLAVTITFEKKQASFNRLLLAPIDLNTLMFAKTSGAIIFGVFNALVPLFFAVLLTDLSEISWLPAIVSIFLISITSTFLGLFIAVSVKEVFEAQTFSNFFRFPMIFLCGLFIPLQNLPKLIRPLSYCLPLTYGADILKYAINGDNIMNPGLNFLLILFFAVVLFVISIKNIKKKWIK
ncbi:ABC transporter permease [Iocasia frigidifontis]|uniref:Transport permease protein n=1 Tax=Iocasia fonsfrigidae TaxID=2682810 RepID=A0A8A7KDX2_9FIRM|nr:ABC transporter permease [Iocasia fonsfrigidae]QTL97629.1 ABC transporter permease [Iocasia fonsfrigidae]